MTTPSKVAFGAVEKLLKILIEGKLPLLGVVENMTRDSSEYISKKVSKLNVDYFGALLYDAQVENAIGDPLKLVETNFAKDVSKVSEKL